MQNIGLYPIESENINKIRVNIDTIKFIEAPVLENTKVGEIVLYIENKEIMRIDILVGKKVNRKNIIDYMKENMNMLYNVRV